MPAPNDRNSRIALAKGWTFHEWYEEAGRPETRSETPLHTHWRNPSYEIAEPRDYVGTLKGVAGLMRELQATRKPMSQWAWYWNDKKQRFVMRHAAWLRRFPFRRQIHAIFYSPKDRPGNCVGQAWLSMFEEEAANASTEA